MIGEGGGGPEVWALRGSLIGEQVTGSGARLWVLRTNRTLRGLTIVEGCPHGCIPPLTMDS